MNIIFSTLKERLEKNKIYTKIEFTHELREITQELITAGLSQTDFFSKAAFHGGTSLRMAHRINRYSEDLDFTLDEKNTGFKWKPYLDEVRKFASQYGCLLEIADKSKDESNVKKAFIKDSSIEQMMEMSWTRKSGSTEKITIKLEMDAAPPSCSVNEIKKLSFPFIFDVKIQNLPSLFAGKCHALLCREYIKGRDWFDLQWFVNKGVKPNYNYLNSMLNQQGPWKGQNIKTDIIWLSDKIISKTASLNFDEVNKDIKRFTNSRYHANFDKSIIEGIIQKFNSKSNERRKKNCFDYDMDR